MKDTRGYRNAFLALALGLGLTSCGNDRETKPEPGPAIPVIVAQVETAGHNTILAGSGQIRAVNSATLGTRVMGQVTSLPVTMGQKVQKGDLLVSIHNVDLRAQSARAEASVVEAEVAYAQAKKDQGRFQNLFGQNAVSPKELEDMTVRFEMAGARLEAAKQMRNEVNSQFAYTQIRAPFNGAVTQTHIEQGDMAHPGMPLVSLESQGGHEVEAKVSEDHISGIEVGTVALVQIKALDTVIKGKVTAVSGSAQNTGGQYVIKVLLEDRDAGVFPGMYANIRLVAREGAPLGEMIVVPAKALVHKGQLTGVYVLGEDNVALLRWLRMGTAHGDEVEVLSGLAKGETYIASSDGKLYNGAKVALQ